MCLIYTYICVQKLKTNMNMNFFMFLFACCKYIYYLCSIKHETSNKRSGTQAYTYRNRLPPSPLVRTWGKKEVITKNWWQQ